MEGFINDTLIKDLLLGEKVDIILKESQNIIHDHAESKVRDVFEIGLSMGTDLESHEKCIIGSKILEMIKNEIPEQFLINCKIDDIIKKFSIRVVVTQLLKKLLLWKKEIIHNVQEDITFTNHFLTQLFKTKDLPYKVIIEGLSLMTNCGCSPNLNVIEVIIFLLYRIGKDRIPIAKEDISVLNTMVKIVNILSTKQFYNQIINLIIEININNQITSPYLALVLPEYNAVKLQNINLGIDDIMKCLSTLLTWPQTNTVSKWVDSLVNLFYIKLIEVDNHKQYCDLLIQFIDHIAPKITAHIFHGLESQGCLRTLENILYIVNSPHIFHKILPSLINALVLYRNTKSKPQKSINFLIEDVITFENITTNIDQLYKPEKSDILASISSEIAHLIYSQIYFHTGHPELYLSVLNAITPLYPLPNDAYLEERVARLNKKHEIIRTYMKKNANKTKISPHHIDTVKSDFMRENDVCGLLNLGNTCYLNSYLQILYMTYSFREYIIHSSGAKFLDIMRYTFASMSLTEKGAIAPSSIFNSLPDYFKTGSQQDSSEFGKILFDLLEDSYKTIKKESPTTLFFEGTLSTTITCNKCQNISNRNETFTDMALSFPDNNEDLRLNDLMDFYFSTETMEGANQYFCENCQGLCDASKRTRLRKAPNHLLLTLSRFYFDVQNLSRHKIIRNVSYSEYINIPVEAEDGKIKEERYVLYGVIIHAGRSTEYGHYYAYCRNTYNLMNGTEDSWIKLNDEHVDRSSFISFNEISKLFPSDVVYILAYMKVDNEKIESKIEIPDDLNMAIYAENKKYLNDRKKLMGNTNLN